MCVLQVVSWLHVSVADLFWHLHCFVIKASSVVCTCLCRLLITVYWCWRLQTWGWCWGLQTCDYSWEYGAKMDAVSFIWQIRQLYLLYTDLSPMICLFFIIQTVQKDIMQWSQMCFSHGEWMNLIADMQSQDTCMLSYSQATVCLT